MIVVNVKSYNMFNKLSETNPEQGKMKLQSPVKINSKTN